ncbi:putative poly [ADP-ribose] polymerase 3 [Acorus gramineus]|uniref:Poly [ADP-ribose] polymerase 3 n=1 Tax=Acorus gramineus TaxID=55184 RepID=A0AAV9AHS7_ACOGR|nr:putative poly [ADP-ribose] polymerase 3 [Acorus gramineus]
MGSMFDTEDSDFVSLAVLLCTASLTRSVANFMKIMCSQEIYRWAVFVLLRSSTKLEWLSLRLYVQCNRYAMMEMGVDSPELPTGMLSNFHLKRCESFSVSYQSILISCSIIVECV